ncbi:Hypothetical_protein [Hexamita inflata]|uniref:Hypothetical_protein n=1 Tax=Hexamita inflata TaxID=28002 RepID=A0AA86PF38_9EUKA|nr:Hypothetical protein HINF_LOCUS25078 [Hexamita inflata]
MITKQYEINSLKQTTAQLCTHQTVILLTLYNFCASGNQDSRTINHEVSFSSAHQFDGSIFFNAMIVNKITYVGQVAENKLMNMFSFVSQGDITATSSSINIQGVRSSFGSLLLAQGSLVVNSSTLNFQFSGTGIGGLVFSSQGMISDNCTVNFLVSAQRGGIFAYAALTQINLQYFNTTGTFTVPTVNLVQVCQNVDIITWEVAILTQVFNQCGSGTCNSFCDSFSICTYCEKTEIQLTSASNYTEQSYIGNGIYNFQCSLKNSFNNSRINIDINIVGKNFYYSVFCTKTAYNHILVTGNYVATSTTTSTNNMIVSIFVNDYLQKAILQNCLLKVDFKAIKWFIAQIFLNSRSLDVSISSLILNITFVADTYSCFYGFTTDFTSASSQLLIQDTKIHYNISSLQQFTGIIFMEMNQGTVLQRLFIKYNVTSSNTNYGLAFKLVSAILKDVELAGKINGNQVIRGIADNLGGYFQIQNLKYSLIISNVKTDSAALVKDMSGASSVAINNIIFEGYTRLNAISFSYTKGSICISGSQTVGSDGMCYCYDTATPQIVNSVRVCKCPGSQTLVSNKCV